MVEDTTNTSADHRAATRYPLALAVEWPGGSGVTKDVSRTGAYWTAECVPAVGEALDVTFRFPGRGTGLGVRVRCGGEVVRVEHTGGRIGVGVRFTALRFEDLEYQFLNT